ncbi:hypothetical protein DL96DRAFT_1814375 [Flagelloscypha sp. PMI_526]|nr:hypothetical protein DL96DRAFT_1814375 [Flagelloscypha sp. PMI_526]
MLVDSDLASKTLEAEDLPPAYDTSTQRQGSPTNATKAAFPLPSGINPTNHIQHLTQYHPAKGKFVIDPHLRIPQNLLPPLQKDETASTRANLRISSGYSNVVAEVWITPGSSSTASSSTPTVPLDKDGAVRLNAYSSYSTCILNVHDDSHTAPLKLSCASGYSSATIYLPRTFVGMINASVTYGKVHFSPAVTANSTMLGQDGKKYRAFVGDLAMYEQEGWRGDEAEISSDYSNVFVYYEDEVVDFAKGISKFFSELPSPGNTAGPVDWLSKLFTGQYGRS